MQTTLRSPTTFSGYGLHSGVASTITIRPASAEHGIWFMRTDIATGDRMVPARWNAVDPSPLCTRLRNSSGVEVSTIEHLMAALMGCGVQNALVEIDSPEVPILDGSALPFVHGIMQRGLRALNAPVRAFEVLKRVSASDGEAFAMIEPSNVPSMDFEICFEEAAIGRQRKSLVLGNGSFARELSDSRTFCRLSDIKAMQAEGFALGGASGENAVVFEGEKVLSPGGLRHSDEPVRHKMLDAFGDLALAGAPLFGHYTGIRAGHALTYSLLRELFSTPHAVRMVLCDNTMTHSLPGFGLAWSEIPAAA